MRIAILSTPHLPTPPRGYGASELIAGQLASGLTDRGHEVQLFAAAESSAAVRACISFPEAARAESFDQREFIHVVRALRAITDCDVVHNHCVVAGPPLAGFCDRPFVTTLHYLSPMVRAFPGERYIAVSESQRQALPDLNVIGAVPNGVDLANFPLSLAHDDYLLFLGRFHPNKGADCAIAAAQRLGRRLIIAAPAPPDDQQEWFDAIIRPQLRDKIEWIGPVEGTAKADLLGRAAATLVPIRWDEPFGLVMIESMACGTPPIAFRRGAAPEIIDDGVSGYLVDDLDGMIARIDQLDRIDPSACRQRVADRFSVDRMIDAYLGLYRSLVDPTAAARSDRASPVSETDSALERPHRALE